MEKTANSVESEDPNRGKSALERLLEKEPCRYLLKAAALAALLTAFGILAPLLPPAAFPAAMLLYAVPATMGTMYGVVADRHYRRYRYAEGGKLASYNRSWSVLLPATFTLHMAAAFLFLLEAPGWSSEQWLLVWLAIPSYYAVLLVVRLASRREYAPLLSESRAIFWSALLTGAMLCIAYALTTTGFSPSDAANFESEVQSRRLLFEGSPCALMCEADKVATYSNFLTRYGLGRIAGASFAAALLVKVILGASVFFGFASQLGLCALRRKDIARVFRLLPNRDGEEGGRPLKRYLASIVAVWLAIAMAFMGGNALAEEMRATEEYTAIDQTLSDATTLIVLIDDTDPVDIKDSVDKAKSLEDLNEQYREGLQGIEERYGEGLKAEIDAYYDECADNVASYIAWKESPTGSLAMIFKPIREKAAKEVFLRKVIEPVDRSGLDRAHDDYAAALRDLHSGYWASWQELHPDAPPASPSEGSDPSAPPQLELWPSWNGGEGALVLESILTSPDAETKALALIEERRAITLSKAEAMKASYALS